MGKANGTIHCRISAVTCEPCVETVIFTPETPIKDGKRQFVAFVPDVPKGQDASQTEGDKMGFVRELCNGRIELEPGKLSAHLLSQAALHNTKVTVIASGDLVLKALIVPADE